MSKKASVGTILATTFFVLLTYHTLSAEKIYRYGDLMLDLESIHILLRTERELELRSQSDHPGFVDPLFRDVPTPKLLEFQKKSTVYEPDETEQAISATAKRNGLPLEVLDATAAIFDKSALVAAPAGGWNLDPTLVTHTLASQGVCTTEKFSSEPAPAICSAFLLKDDIVATAGHCVRDIFDTANKRFVFGFHADASGNVPTSFATNQVYTGKLLDRYYSAWGADWALVRLSGKPPRRTPIPYRTTGVIDSTEILSVVGYSAGLPAKWAPNATIMKNKSSQYFVATLDVYAGNSGSPVLNARNEVEGILVRGEIDFVPGAGCLVKKKCPQNGSGCLGEHVTRITQLPPLALFP